MRLIYRIFFVLIGFIAMLVCYPDYPQYSIFYIAVNFLICFAAVFVLTGLCALFFEGSKVLNFILDIFILAGLCWYLLTVWPVRSDGESPLNKVLKGQYPAMSDVDRGLSRLGIGNTKDIKQEFDKTVGEINKNLAETKQAVTKEAKI